MLMKNKNLRNYAVSEEALISTVDEGINNFV